MKRHSSPEHVPSSIRDLPLSIFLSFEEVVARQSFQRAALHLNLHPTTVGRHIRELEKVVGIALVRRTRPVVPTTAGLALRAVSREIVSQARQLRTLVEGLR